MGDALINGKDRDASFGHAAYVMRDGMDQK